MIKKQFRGHACPTAARGLAKSIGRFLEQDVSDPELLYELELAITEACSNIFLHAYEGRPGGEIRINLNLEPKNRLILEIMDWGHPFQEPPESGPLRPESHQENGRGVYLISKIMDKFQYIRTKDKNTLYLEKKIEESP